MDVQLHPQAEAELQRLPKPERTAMLAALEKLRAVGAELPFPHSSQVQGTKLRELRPRAGRSPWRAFYRRVGAVLRVGAVGPEAKHDPQGFRAAVARAERRLEEPLT